MVGDTARITSTTPLSEGQWHHIAIVRSSGTSRMYINGVREGGTYSDSTNYSFTQFYIGRRENGTNQLYGKVSNLRLVVGTAVYTSSFRPPTEPLTNITNTKLLCLNSSSVTGTTVGTIQISGNTDLSPTASTDSPFDDPGNFIFGDSGDQNIIKTGYYIGNGDSTNGLEVELGFEPQFVWIKADGTGTDANYNWLVFDTMRRMDNNKTDNTHDSGKLHSSNNIAEVTDDDGINVSPTGFKIQGNGDDRNGDGHQYIYIAIRASEGYVSKVPDAGSAVFAMDTGNSSATIPTFDSGFPVDFMIRKNYDSTVQWTSGSRLTGLSRLAPNENYAEVSDSTVTWDSNVGWGATSQGTSLISHMWKRHAGMDVVCYTGNWANSHSISHNLSKIPEMIWVKNREDPDDWAVYHKGLNGGTNPEQYYLQLNTYNPEADLNTVWSDTAPTSTHFTVGGNVDVNNDDEKYVAMLFASVSGISSIGSYAGSDTSNVTVNCGFQPRFVIIKENTATRQWVLFDTLRGIQSPGVDQQLYLSAQYIQDDDFDYEMSGEGDSLTCRCSAVRRKDGKKIYGSPVSLEMAKAEGWTKNSKWRTMPQLMLNYRAASFFGRQHVADLLLGVQTEEEVVDIEPVNITPDQKGKVSTEEVKGQKGERIIANTPHEAAISQPQEAEDDFGF